MTVEPKKKISSRIKAGGLIVAMATSFTGGFEGLRQYAYPDPATKGPPWTVCYGRAYGVRPGDHHSVSECKRMLAEDLGKEAEGIDKCLTRVATDGQAVAFLSLAHNIGVGGFCKSSIVRDFNQGNVRAACNDLLKYNRAAGVVFPGLTRRREAERGLCLQGVE